MSKKKKRKDETPEDDSLDAIYERMMNLSGIPIPIASLLSAISEPPPSYQKRTVASLAADKPSWAGHTVVSQAEHACCSMNAYDGLIFYALNKKGSATVAADIPEKAGVAIVRILAVDEHSGRVIALNTDAEAMKKLMNQLPELIKSAEIARDEAVAILADE